MNDVLKNARRIVVKVGSSLVTNEGKGVDAEAIGTWCRQMAALAQDGREVIMVSSGAIAEGMKRLGWATRPKEIHALQAAAAVGQMGLAQMYETKLREHGMGSAQVLLTHADLADRERYLNARSTLLTLLSHQVVPVINENDTVVTDEIKFGDNDTLGALVANLVEADALVILTDQKGLYSADPRKDPGARFIDVCTAGDPALEQMAGGAGSRVGTGGMITKVLAAKRAAGSGASTVIAWGREPDVLVRLTQGEAIGSLFVADTAKLTARKQWMADHLQLRGAVVIDDGAVAAAARRRQEPAAHRHDRGGRRVLPGRRDRRAQQPGPGRGPGLGQLRQQRGAPAGAQGLGRHRGGPGLHQRARNDPPRQPRAGLSVSRARGA
jgi:glutamate 5-kinase